MKKAWMSKSLGVWILLSILPVKMALADVAEGASGALPLGEVSGVVIGEEQCGVSDQAPLLLQQPYTCLSLDVGCPKIETRPVRLRITEPPLGVRIRATVIVGLGGGGRGWYELAGNGVAASLLDRLNLEGFRVIQRAWGEDPNDPASGGWISGSVGLLESACRYSTLVHWIYDQAPLHDPASAAFCATGNSGGASEIGYGLAAYGLENLLDLALLSAGPAHGVLAEGCNTDDPAWELECNGLLDGAGICPPAEGARECFFPVESVEEDIDSAWELVGIAPCADQDLPLLAGASVLYPMADLDHPQTRVHAVMGGRDCTSAPPVALPYLAALAAASTGPVTGSVVPGAGHSVPASAAGRLALGSVLLAGDGCVGRH